MKTIITHFGPDLDAICAIWIVKNFFPGWEEAALAFVPAGNTLNGLPPEDNPEVMHVDTGFGKFDHHQTDDDICASVLIYRELCAVRSADPAIARLIAIVNDIDHFREAFFPNPTADNWNFCLHATIDGWRMIHPDDPLKIVALGMEALDGIYKTFQNKIWAEKEIAENSTVFDLKWGKALASETPNDEIVHLAQKMGYVLVIRKDPHKGYLRIKALPREEIDLTGIYTALKAKDTAATWFLHVSRHMILNGSAKNPQMRPTSLTLSEIIDLVKFQAA